MEMEADEPVDPLANYWGLALFPSASLPPSQPCDLNQDLLTLHTHLRSMALQSPVKLADQAKSIIDRNPELFRSENSVVTGSSQVNGDDAVVFAAEEDEGFRRPHRPGLGLKRPRFSIKPAKMPSIESLLPPLDLENLKDPVEFILAHERRENAKKEIQKQWGIEEDEDNVSTRPRQRRPGLLGDNQRPVKYRHRYPKENYDNNSFVLSFQETFSQEPLGPDTVEPVGENIDKSGACPSSLENEVSDSSAVEDKKLDEILDGLLSCNSEDLEGAVAISLLQEKLQIKPVALENLSVPDFPDSQTFDLKSLRRNSPKPRKALSNIDNLLKGMNKTPVRQNVRCPVQQSASPTPPRSPFASLPSLHRHILQSKQSVDPFSALEIDHLSKRNTINQKNDLVSSGKLSNEQSSHMIEDANAIGKTSGVLDTDQNCTSIPENSKEDNSVKSSNKLDMPSTEDMVAVGGTDLADDAVRNCTSTSPKSMMDNSRELSFDANIDTTEPHVVMDVDIGGSGKGERIMDETIDRSNTEANEPHDGVDMDIGGSGMNERVMDDIVDRSNVEANESCQSKDKVENPLTFTASMPTDDMNFNLVNSLADQSNLAGYQANSTDSAKRSDDDPKHRLQEKTDGSRMPVNGPKRVKRKAARDKKLHRQSLAAAGTSWNDDGLRRSTRIRTRPLEYWKGERLVYGRVHESLATVIGVKCMSPGSDGKPTMKVKSYVSDKYKDLLEIASLY